ncbi:PepSY-associated TM helix domain-containing protein [Pedobacter sp. KR3-3]|uniref:PepSY-associated TM helix domain-containing protein n=1 Tax=Pedobacter albus TaxID=3113905 RepID=A0ABU7IAE3_9SPHI|nr:PepSY-associated TM helix domain-containing protein [Pedobacter sp. KR3-3]MEE1946457.1 PepSY-associated TM helix domain-containing protein [Pedobacter sp. KR3-3]
MTSTKNNPTPRVLTSKKATAQKSGKSAKKDVAKLSRWLHIYLSMASFAIVLFFAVTGLTLNHPSWLGGDKQIESKLKGTLNAKWVNNPDTNKVAKLEIVEWMRSKHQVKGAVSEFRIDDSEVTVTFKGPAYSADAFIDREKGTYELSEIKMGIVAIMNDLHKGRDSGKGWGWVIDISAIFLTLVSLTGLILMLFLKKKRVSGLVSAIIGLLLCYLLYVWLVP